MTVLLPLLMAYSLIGETFHEVVGTLIFVLFIVHHIINRKWYGALMTGKYNVKKIFQTVLNLLLLVFMVLQPLCGVLMSKHLYTFLPVFPISSLARSIHMMLAYWGYVLTVHSCRNTSGGSAPKAVDEEEKDICGSLCGLRLRIYLRMRSIHKAWLSGVYVGKHNVCFL